MTQRADDITIEGADVPADAAAEDERRDLLEWLTAALDVWRTRIDELLVQADLAGKDLGDEFRSRVVVAENAYLAARRRLGELPHDAGTSLSSVRAAMESLLSDVRRAYEAAEAAVRRGGSTVR